MIKKYKQFDCLEIFIIIQMSQQKLLLFQLGMLRGKLVHLNN